MRAKLLVRHISKWPRWMRGLLWQSRVCGIRVWHRKTSLSIYKRWQDNRWAFHYGPSWMA